jgi:proteasome lid subunit RPN8/RPN11
MQMLRIDGALYREMVEHGIFHTHTHSEAYPSETDLRLAFYPDACYLVMSLSDRERPVLRAFRIVDGEITEEELEVA